MFFKSVSTEVVIEVRKGCCVVLLLVLLRLGLTLANSSLGFWSSVNRETLAISLPILIKSLPLAVDLLEDGGLQEFSAGFSLGLRFFKPEPLVQVQSLWLRVYHDRLGS